MPFTNNPANNLADRVRLNVGDVYDDMDMLDDGTYQFLLDKYNNNTNRASVEAARYIIFKLTRWTREKAGDIEVFGSEWFKNYRQALTDFTRNPNLTLSVSMPYAGGISRPDMQQNDANATNARGAIWAGLNHGAHTYKQTHLIDNPSFFDGNDLWGGFLSDGASSVP